MNLDGEIALVSGASRGIGAAIADQLAAHGAFVIGTATSDTGAAAISERLGERGTGIALDISNAEDVTTKLAELSKAHGAISILVNNAGITADTLLLRMNEADWDKVIQTNLGGVYRMSKAVLKGMTRARKGRIISVTSVVGQMGNPGQTNYCASKAGVVGFTKSLAREVGARGITVNAVAPGFIDTDMTQALSDEQRDNMSAAIPLKRLGAAEDIAAAVLFLASPAANYITGETINVNGGMNMA